MKVLQVAAAMAVVFTLSACASVVRGQSQTIAITTPPTTGANCVLSSKQGNWTVISPGPVTVQRSKEDIQVRCNKEGYQEGFSTIPSNFEGWTLGNILLGGVIGLGVDAATGAINQYPNAFQVPMYPAPTAAAPSAVTPVATTSPTS